MSEFYGILTTVGAAVCAQSIETGLEAKITTFVIGDGHGDVPRPDATQTELVNTVFTGQLNSLSQDKTNPSILIAEAVLPAAIGPFWIREMGIKTADGTLVAVCSMPPQYKVATEEGASGTMVIRMNVIFTEGAKVTLIVDDSTVLATRNYVDQKVSEEMAAHLEDDDPHFQYLKEEEADEKYLQIAQNLAEIKAAGEQAIAQAKDNLLIPQDIAQAIAEHEGEADPHTQYLTNDDMQVYIPVGFPMPWPGATPPAGWLKCNGAAFSTALYPKLAQAYPSGTLPDLRGEFIRGWDDMRRVDRGRALLSAQKGTLLAFDGYSTGYPRSLPFPKLTNDTDPFNGDDFEGAAPDVHTTEIIAERNGVGTVTGGYNAVITRPRNVAFNYIVRAA
ncbi:phage tail protein [Buttiauxella selenatireducens]|uniref:Phage tail protein n=1 Tax=Buttiauxella selenatireducens TaxID=3073902 RepID=A0ABY9S5K8_9ENTR|nr:phage tail protein [Buttiauxella sp. R73]WMY72718.1 phage tail protein [Buttiauxella sp. R73]